MEKMLYEKARKEMMEDMEKFKKTFDDLSSRKMDREDFLHEICNTSPFASRRFMINSAILDAAMFDTLYDMITYANDKKEEKENDD